MYLIADIIGCVHIGRTIDSNIYKL